MNMLNVQINSQYNVINNHVKFTKFSYAFLTLNNLKIKKKEESYSSTINKPIIPASA